MNKFHSNFQLIAITVYADDTYIIFEVTVLAQDISIYIFV